MKRIGKTGGTKRQVILAKGKLIVFHQKSGRAHGMRNELSFSSEEALEGSSWHVLLG